MLEKKLNKKGIEENEKTNEKNITSIFGWCKEQFYLFMVNYNYMLENIYILKRIMIRCSMDENNFSLCLHHGHLGVILVYNLNFKNL